MSVSGNALVIKEININLVRRTLKAHKQATKHQIAAATGLSLVTVGTILQQLVEDQIAFEGDLVASMGGRPAQQFRFNENHAHVLVLFTHEHHGRDTLHIRVADLFGSSLYEQDVELTDINLHSFEPYIDAALEAYPTIQAIGFGLPGVESGGKIILMDYPALIDTSFLAHYQQRYQLPVIFLNDVNAACVGYCKRHQLESEAAVVYLYFPRKYPPGSGIYINGKLYKGMSGFAGEVAGLPFGINWYDADLYASPESISAIIERLIIALVSILNPHSIILYGDFLTADQVADIQQRCAAQMPARAIPALQFSSDFTQDYQHGIIEETLAVLEPQISISRSSS